MSKARRATLFIPVDTSVLYGPPKEKRVLQCNEKAFVVLAVEHWATSFTICKVQGEGSKEFTRTVRAIVSTFAYTSSGPSRVGTMCL